MAEIKAVVKHIEGVTIELTQVETLNLTTALQHYRELLKAVDWPWVNKFYEQLNDVNRQVRVVNNKEQKR